MADTLVTLESLTSEIGGLAISLDAGWTIIAGVLVFFMQDFLIHVPMPSNDFKVILTRNCLPLEAIVMLPCLLTLKGLYQ